MLNNKISIKTKQQIARTISAGQHLAHGEVYAFYLGNNPIKGVGDLSDRHYDSIRVAFSESGHHHDLEGEDMTCNAIKDDIFSADMSELIGVMVEGLTLQIDDLVVKVPTEATLINIRTDSPHEDLPIIPGTWVFRIQREVNRGSSSGFSSVGD